MKSFIKQIIWVGDSKKCIQEFPEEVKKAIGHYLYFAQCGDHHPHIKTLKGLGGKMYEVYEDHRSGTYRAIYMAQIELRIYVLHAFQKKSKSGISTPKKDIELVKARLKFVKGLKNEG